MKKSVRNILVVTLIVTVILPLIPLVFYAFAKVWPYPNLFPEWSMDSFDRLFSVFDVSKVMLQSIMLSASVTLLSFMLAFFPAKLIGTREFKGRRALEIFLIIPALAPGITVVFGLIGVMASLHIYKTFIGLVLGQMTFTLPYMMISLTSVFRNYDTTYEDQAATLGIDKFDTLLFITIPSIKSGIAVGCMYTFMVSWSMYLLTSIYAPAGFDTMATLLFPQINGVYSNMFVAALAIIFFLPALFVLVLSGRLMDSDKVNSHNGGLT